MKDKAIILLSSGLDSVVSLALAQKEYDIKLALTFDYGQKAKVNELKYSKKICQFYKIKHKTIKLPWLKKLIRKKEQTTWVANRNGLFLNIAGSFCDELKYNTIIFGANAQEAVDFKDNSKEFVEAINQSFIFSTNTQCKAFSPILDLSKNEIVQKGIENSVPFEFVHSCYEKSKKNCGKCASCRLLKDAVINTKNERLLKILF